MSKRETIERMRHLSFAAHAVRRRLSPDFPSHLLSFSMPFRFRPPRADERD
jgi:hypothetical protein